MATGLAPEVTADPFTQILSSMRIMLLLASGPSSVAVRVGASRTSKTIDVVVGRRWNCTGVILGSDVSCQPEKPSVAERFVFVSSGFSSTSMLQEPSKPTADVRLTVPLTEEVKASHTSGTVSLLAMDENTLVGVFSRDSCPVTMVVAPAPTIGALMAFGPVWLMIASSVTLT